jgi:hypothetical protein
MVGEQRHLSRRPENVTRYGSSPYTRASPQRNAKVITIEERGFGLTLCPLNAGMEYNASDLARPLSEEGMGHSHPDQIRDIL